MTRSAQVRPLYFLYSSDEEAPNADHFHKFVGIAQNMAQSAQDMKRGTSSSL